MTSAKNDLLEADLIAPDRSARGRVADWILLRSQGLKNPEIAAKLGIQTKTLNTLISKAIKDGWLKIDDPADRLEHELTPLIVDGIKEHLLRKSEKMIIEAARGVGLFKTHQAIHVDDQNKGIALALNIEIKAPEGSNKPTTSNIVGTPKLPVIEAEVTKVE